MPGSTDASHTIAAVRVRRCRRGYLQGGFPAGYEPLVAKASDGRLWFIGPNGVNILDPRRLNFNTLPPPVHVERMVADHKPFDVGRRRCRASTCRR